MSIFLNPRKLTKQSEFFYESQKFVNWCKFHALPFWANKGTDPTGGFYETLNYDGTPDISVKRRVRVQARQSYVYSLAAINGWYQPSKAVADNGWAFLTQQGLAGGGSISSDSFNGCAHLLNPDGSLYDGMRDTYAQAFLLLASAWRYRATSDPHALEILYATTSFLTRHFKSEYGGWIEDCGNSLPRRQNPHMHLFEAFMAAYEATNDTQFLDLASEVFDLFKNYFFDVKNQCVLEYFTNDWNPVDRNYARVEPGHMMEWCWLLEWYGRLSGKTVKQYADALFVSAIKNGLNPVTGLLIDEYRLDRCISKTSSRLWPQTEFIKACLARHRLGHEDALAHAALVIETLFAFYLNTPLLGGWHDSLSGTGKVCSSQMPASTFYHLACVVNELEKIIN